MTIRSILALFGGGKEELVMLETACDLAVTHQAQLRCLHVSPEPAATMGLYGEAFVATPAIVDAIEEDNRKRLESARREFAALMERRRIAVQNQGEAAPNHHPSAMFLHAVGNIENIVPEEARCSDLVMLHHELGKETSALFEYGVSATLFASARPVVLIPAAKTPAPLDQNILLAWNNSRESAAAVAGAMPFLSRAEKVHVLMVREHRALPDQEAGHKILAYLKLHGIKAETTILDREKHDTGALLIAQAKALKAGLLVMGAYGHNRFRETLFGGVTEHMLEHADIPLLMAHA